MSERPKHLISYQPSLFGISEPKIIYQYTLSHLYIILFYFLQALFQWFSFLRRYLCIYINQLSSGITEKMSGMSLGECEVSSERREEHALLGRLKFKNYQWVSNHNKECRFTIFSLALPEHTANVFYAWSILSLVVLWYLCDNVRALACHVVLVTLTSIFHSVSRKIITLLPLLEAMKIKPSLCPWCKSNRAPCSSFLSHFPAPAAPRGGNRLRKTGFGRGLSTNALPWTGGYLKSA